MSPDQPHDKVQIELSTAHDEGGPISEEALRHIETCDACAAFAEGLTSLDHFLSAGRFDLTPDVTDRVMSAISPRRSQWWSVAAVALVGVTVGALVGVLGSRLDVGQAQDLHVLFHATGSAIDVLSADLLIVERGIHPDLPERVYSGSLDYVAPEQLSVELIDTTEYPDAAWVPNDVRFAMSNGDSLSIAGSACPVAALPGCLVAPSAQFLSDQPPFDEGFVSPLEIVGPGRSLTWSSGIEVVATPTLHGRPTIQLESTVAAVDLLGAITNRGSWRELHPTDGVLMWLDEKTLVPLRIEVFPTASPERELWQLRHDYRDDLGSLEPLFIVQLSNLSTSEAGAIEVDTPPNAPSRGFVDGRVEIPEPALDSGFELHRSGLWALSNGGEVMVAAWSDGRSWLMVEATTDWDEPRVFGLAVPFVVPVDLGAGSVGFIAPTGDALAIHTEDLDLLVSGSVPVDLLLEAARSLEVDGMALPSDWAEASTVPSDQLPSMTLVPDMEGWSIVGRVEDSQTIILLVGGGSRTVLVTQEEGTRLGPPTGPDFSEVTVRGQQGRYDASSTTLEWVDAGRIIRMRSDTVGMTELLDLADAMESR